MTNRDRIIKHLEENGMDLWWLRYEEIKDKWQRAGTVVISGDYTEHTKEIKAIAEKHGKIEINQIRDRFEWQYASRIRWIGEKA